jgi:MFS family permease
MYQVENAGDLLRNRRAALGSRLWPSVGANVFLLGLTSLLTDISVEMVTTTLPVYLMFGLRLAPLHLGLIDGLYQGAGALVQVASGILADRWRRAKLLATTGYAFSAACKLALLLVGGNWIALSGIVVLDRIGKGIRTAPRDALIAASAPEGRLGTAFGVHRAMDTVGAMLGPLLATALLILTVNQYDTVFLVSLCIAGIGLGVIVFLVKTPASPAPDPSGAVSSIGALRRLLGQSDFRRLVLVSTALALVTMSDNLIYLAVRRMHSTRLSTFPLLYVGTACWFMLLAIPLGRLADRIGRKRVFVMGYGVLILVYCALLFPLPRLASIAVIAGLGFYYAATDGVLMAHASAILPESLRATGLAILTTGSSLARLFASIAYGTMWQWWGPARATRVFLWGLLCAVIIVLTMPHFGPRERRCDAAV